MGFVMAMMALDTGPGMVADMMLHLKLELVFDTMLELALDTVLELVLDMVIEWAVVAIVAVGGQVVKSVTPFAQHPA